MRITSWDLGNTFEQYINKECKVLESEGSVFVSKNWEAPKKGGSFVSISTSKPDYSGFTADGKHVVFDAKATQNDFFAVSSLSKHQYEHLKNAHEHNAFAFVYALHYSKDTQDKYVIPMWFVIDMKSKRKNRVKFELIQQFKKEPMTTFDEYFNLLYS